MSDIPISKEQLEFAIHSIFINIMCDYRSIPANISRQCGIEGNIKGTEISVCDTVAYLIGWGKLVLKWYKLKAKNMPVDFPETGYKWNKLGLLANSFHIQYSQWDYNDLLTEFELKVNEILVLIASLINQELYEKPWYEKWTLGRMIQFNTYSPMKNMRTKIRRFKKTRWL